MSLTLKHVTVATSALVAASLAATVTLPAAAQRASDARRISAQADAVAALPASAKANAATLGKLRVALPAGLTNDAAAGAVDDLARAHQLTWSTLGTGPARRSTLQTALGDVTVTSVPVTATVTGDRAAVRDLMAAVATATPMMTVSSLTLRPDGAATTATLTVLVHGTQETP